MKTVTLKDHEIAEFVNQLTECAKEFGQTQQLRCRMSELVHQRLGVRTSVFKAPYVIGTPITERKIGQPWPGAPYHETMQSHQHETMQRPHPCDQLHKPELMNNTEAPRKVDDVLMCSRHF